MIGKSIIGPVLSYTAVFLLLGGGGMHFANRSVDANTQQQRWVKFVTYIVIVGSAIATILLNQFHLLAILIAAIGLWEILSHTAKLLSTANQVIAIGIYIAIAASFLSFANTFNSNTLLFIYFQVFIFDGFSQVIGQLFGQRRILPTISPRKTLEGLAGGTSFCMIAVISAKSWVDLPIQAAVGSGLLTAMLSFSGDILASYFKRKAKIKDYSQLLPGHGGVLDRFDSLMMTGMGYTLLSILQLSIQLPLGQYLP